MSLQAWLSPGEHGRERRRLLGLTAALASAQLALVAFVVPPLSERLVPNERGSLERGIVPAAALDSEQTSGPDYDARTELARCEAERDRIVAEPALPGAPKLEANRVAVLGHAKADPVLFVRAPELEANDDPKVKRYRRTFEIAKFPWDVTRWLAPRFLHHPEHGRATLLREGYLYADDPALAFALVDHISAHHLFDANRIWIERGQFVRHAERTKTGKYVYADGPDKGKPVRLLLFDRIGTGAVPPALHRDLRSLRHRLHFDRFEVVHMTEDRILANVRYGRFTVPSIFEADGPKLELRCELVPPQGAEEIAALRQFGARKERVMQSLRRAMVAQIEEGIPFDEPITEFGQQDGFMRYKWLSAYVRGHQSYRMNGDKYFVFDPDGRPKPPQVCIDFVWDTIERASGTWWEKFGEEPRRVVGKIDFKTYSDTTLRRADSLVRYAKSHPERFDLTVVPDRERVPMWQKDRFFNYLVRNAGDFQVGDVVVIRGYTSFERRWERRVMHYHSFFVYEVDPVSGVPIALVGNPGRPGIRTWFFEGLRTPKRAIWYSVRPKVEWLEGIVALEEHPVLEPPTLSAEPT
jgi:hypothetical protein